jgi:acetyl esterase
MSDSETKQHFVRPDVQACLNMLEAMVSTPMHELPVAEARQTYLAMRHVADADPTELAIIRDLHCAGPAGDIPLRYYDKRAERDSGPAIIFVHGGGFVIGDLDTHHPFCTFLADQLDLPVIAVDYRLAPEHPFPAAAQDAVAVARWLAESPKELGLNITGLIPVGDSAGGNLAIVISQSLATNPAKVPVIAQMPIYPVVSARKDWQSMNDFADGFVLTRDGMNWFDNAYQPDNANPLYNVIDGFDHALTPPTVLITAGLDPLRDQGRAYGAKLLEAGVTTSFYEARGTVHGLIGLRKVIPSGEQDCKNMTERLHSLLSNISGQTPS